ncbi:MAG: magnesium protoporphyrin IX methyltransferase [Gammaproteobacteria bacterium]
MTSTSYRVRRKKLTTYFDQTAAKAWSQLTSDAPVGRVRATVRAGRDAMRAQLMSWLPDDMSNKRLLDAGCGTGTLAIEVAERGGSVLAVDVSETLVEIGAKRTPAKLADKIDYRVGDMLDREFGVVDFVVAMDSLIHYDADDIVSMLSVMAERTQDSIMFTVAPSTPALMVMHAVGRLIPYQEHRAPAIVPISQSKLRDRIALAPALQNWTVTGCEKISSGFYKSQAFKLTKND